MKAILQIMLSIICFILFSGCGTVKPVLHEGNNFKNYESIFREKAPSNVEVLNSVYVTYSGWNFGVNTSPDWEIELIVPNKWLKDKIKDLHLRKVKKPKNRVLRLIEYRLKRAKKWYAPKSISSYDCYYLYLTSIPYVHMLVDKKTIKKNRHKVFLSKH